MPKLLVDTYNVLHITGVLPPDLAGLDTPALARLIARSRYAASSPALVCDGQTPPDMPDVIDGVRIIYAGRGGDADSLLEQMVRADSAPRSVTVVSSDRRVQAAARKRRAIVLSSEQFLRTLAADASRPEAPTKGGAKPPAPLAPGLVEDWLIEFGYDARAVLARAGRDKPAPTPRAAPDREQRNSREREPQRRKHLPDEAAKPEEPILTDELRRWAGGIDPSELDMARIVPDAVPLRKKQR